MRVEGLAIETIELERKGHFLYYDSMKILTEQHPDTDCAIIGADMVYLPKWYRIDELVDMVPVCEVQPTPKAGTSYPVIWVDVPHELSRPAWWDFLPKVET